MAPALKGLTAGAAQRSSVPGLRPKRKKPALATKATGSPTILPVASPSTSTSAAPAPTAAPIAPAATAPTAATSPAAQRSDAPGLTPALLSVGAPAGAPNTAPGPGAAPGSGPGAAPVASPELRLLGGGGAAAAQQGAAPGFQAAPAPVPVKQGIAPGFQAGAPAQQGVAPGFQSAGGAAAPSYAAGFGGTDFGWDPSWTAEANANGIVDNAALLAKVQDANPGLLKDGRPLTKAEWENRMRAAIGASTVAAGTDPFRVFDPNTGQFSFNTQAGAPLGGGGGFTGTGDGTSAGEKELFADFQARQKEKAGDFTNDDPGIQVQGSPNPGGGAATASGGFAGGGSQPGTPSAAGGGTTVPPLIVPPQVIPPPQPPGGSGGGGGGGGGGGTGAGVVAGADPFSQSVLGGLGAGIAAGGGPQTAFGQGVQGTIQNVLASGGKLPNNVADAQLKSVREELQRFRESSVAGLKSQLGETGNLSLPGVQQGATTAGLGAIETGIADRFATAARDIGTAQSKDANQTFLQAMSTAAASADADTKNFISLLDSATNRQLGQTALAIEQLKTNNAFNQFLAQYGLDRAKTLEQIRQGRILSLAPFIQNFLTTAQISQQGFAA